MNIRVTISARQKMKRSFPMMLKKVDLQRGIKFAIFMASLMLFLLFYGIIKNGLGDTAFKGLIFFRLSNIKPH